MPAQTIRTPNSQQRIAIIGRTGSGKTAAGLWYLSKANYMTMPWVILDFKGDELVNSIEHARHIDLKDTPKKAGVYIAHAEPDDPELEPFLRRIWRKGDTGLFIDEGYMLSEKSDVEKRFRTLLTQGRSLHIPMIVLSQRPSWISRFVFSEADFFQIYHLNDDSDVQRVASFLPKGAYQRMPDYHSVHYDVGKNILTYLKPVPPPEDVVLEIDSRLRPNRKIV